MGAAAERSGRFSVSAPGLQLNCRLKAHQWAVLDFRPSKTAHLILILRKLLTFE